MSKIEKEKLLAVHETLVSFLGDTEPFLDDDMTDDEIRQEEPIYWAAVEIAKLVL